MTREAEIGKIIIGGGHSVAVQTMYDRPLSESDPDEIVRRISSLHLLGCDIMRIAFASFSDSEPFRRICAHSPVPVVADIHFDYKMAIAALDAGADKIRINPGNIGAEWKVKEVVKAAAGHNAAIRIGLNSGSLPENMRTLPPSQAMVNSAMDYVSLLEGWGFANLVVSLKSSSPEDTESAARMFARSSDVPQHIGVTEAGSPVISAVRSTVVLSRLLSEGIGDTIRISMTGDMEDEVIAASELLRTLGLRKKGVRIVSCPRCGRCSFDTIGFEKDVRMELLSLDRDITVAIMGCQVNGPGEAADADYAVVGSGSSAAIYRRGALVMRTTQSEARKALFEVIGEE